jgi:septal ring factor EnvC (AmiA/AmiB activator)
MVEIIEKIVPHVVSMLLALGGLEFIKWVFNRKTDKRLAEATADYTEVKTDTDEFHLLRERLELADRQLLEKEQRFYEQTDELRKTTSELLTAERKISDLNGEVSALKAERKMKLCEVRNCSQRVPQSGY